MRQRTWIRLVQMSLGIAVGAFLGTVPVYAGKTEMVPLAASVPAQKQTVVMMPSATVPKQKPPTLIIKRKPPTLSQKLWAYKWPILASAAVVGGIAYAFWPYLREILGLEEKPMLSLGQGGRKYMWKLEPAVDPAVRRELDKGLREFEEKVTQQENQAYRNDDGKYGLKVPFSDFEKFSPNEITEKTREQQLHEEKRCAQQKELPGSVWDAFVRQEDFPDLGRLPLHEFLSQLQDHREKRGCTEQKEPTASSLPIVAPAENRFEERETAPVPPSSENNKEVLSSTNTSESAASGLRAGMSRWLKGIWMNVSVPW